MVKSPDRLAPRVRAALADRDNDRFVSSATAWEISIKCSAGRLTFPLDRFSEIVSRVSATPLSINSAHAVAAGELPLHHRDPFDRILIAQSVIETLVLVTDDPAMKSYDVPLLSILSS